MQKKSGLAVRLKALRREKGVTSQVVADAIGIKSATYRRYEIDTKPRDEVYVALADYFGVSVDYLMSGKDHAGVLTAADSEEYKTASSAGLTADEALLLRKLRTLSSSDFEEVMKFIDWKYINERQN